MSASQHGLLALLHRANQIASDRFSETIGDHGLTARQVQVLAAIEANEGGSQTDIVNITGIDRSTLADIIRRLSNRKLIERRRTKEDARAYAVKLTDAGRNELALGKPAVGKVEQNLLSVLPANRQTDLLALLEFIVASGQQPAAPV